MVVVDSGFNNSCLLPSLVIPNGTHSLDACKFVIETTDQLWNLKVNISQAFSEYFIENYTIISTSGTVQQGQAGLKNYTYSTMTAFPDIKIQILDCFCVGNDEYGYKCTMPDLLTGTNTGPSEYGPPTGKKVKYMGLVNSLVKNFNGKWQYVMEWGVHDIVTLLYELGMDNIPSSTTNDEQVYPHCQTWIQYIEGYYF